MVYDNVDEADTALDRSEVPSFEEGIITDLEHKYINRSFTYAGAPWKTFYINVHPKLKNQAIWSVENCPPYSRPPKTLAMSLSRYIRDYHPTSQCYNDTIAAEY